MLTWKRAEKNNGSNVSSIHLIRRKREGGLSSIYTQRIREAQDK